MLCMLVEAWPTLGCWREKSQSSGPQSPLLAAPPSQTKPAQESSKGDSGVAIMSLSHPAARETMPHGMVSKLFNSMETFPAGI